MTDSTPRPTPTSSESSSYSDPQAMDDIQSLITSRDRSKGEDTVDKVSEVVERTGRSIATPRLFKVAQEIQPNGMPVVFISTEGTAVRVAQNPETGSIDVSIMPVSRHDERNLRVKVDGQQVVPAVKDDMDAEPSDDSAQDPAEGSAS